MALHQAVHDESLLTRKRWTTYARGALKALRLQFHPTAEHPGLFSKLSLCFLHYWFDVKTGEPKPKVLITLIAELDSDEEYMYNYNVDKHYVIYLMRMLMYDMCTYNISCTMHKNIHVLCSLNYYV
jgi:hypothetical protein